jgi:3-hydroxybutyryl-CoA dehydrogenase
MTDSPSAPEIESVAIVGSGFMGRGIAESAARAGLDVTLIDISDEVLDAARAEIEASLQRAVSGGKLEASDASAALDRVSASTQVVAASEADIAIEAVSEELELKLEIFSELDRLMRPDAARMGKTPILTKDRSGFIVNMLLVPYLMAAVRMYEDGFASREDIDTGMKLGCGHPMGPLTLCDFVGLDVLYAVCDSLYEEFKEPAYAPPPLMKRMVASGRLGRKAGRGFYDY